MKFLFLLLLLPSFVLAGQIPDKNFSAETLRQGASHNLRSQNFWSLNALQPLRPAPEVDNVEYVLVTEGRGYEAGLYKDTLVKNFPPHMKLVVLVTPGYEESNLNYYSRFIPKSRLIIASHADAAMGFWARDSFPYPVYLKSGRGVGLVAAKYQRPFAAASVIAGSLSAKIQNENFFFVGGNLMADEAANCFVVESARLYRLSDATLTRAYGCQKVVRFPHLSGIGDIDEVVKILPGKRALTNQESYKAKLEALGYQVSLVPPLTDKRTYINSVILDKTVFMPSYDLPTDQDAIAAYEREGYKVIPVSSEKISTVGMGSFHCITMLYPSIDVSVLLNQLGAKRFN